MFIDYREVVKLEVPQQEACHYMKGSPQSSRPGKPCSSVVPALGSGVNGQGAAGITGSCLFKEIWKVNSI